MICMPNAVLILYCTRMHVFTHMLCVPTHTPVRPCAHAYTHILAYIHTHIPISLCAYLPTYLYMYTGPSSARVSVRLRATPKAAVAAPRPGSAHTHAYAYGHLHKHKHAVSVSRGMGVLHGHSKTERDGCEHVNVNLYPWSSQHGYGRHAIAGTGIGNSGGAGCSYLHTHRQYHDDRQPRYVNSVHLTSLIQPYTHFIEQ